MAAFRKLADVLRRMVRGRGRLVFVEVKDLKVVGIVLGRWDLDNLRIGRKG